MSFIISDRESLRDLCLVLAGEACDNNALVQAAEAGEEILFAENGAFVLDKPVNIRRPVKIRGNHACLSGDVPYGIGIYCSDVEVSDLVIDKVVKGVMIDAEDHTAENITLKDLIINDPGYGVGINIGSTKSHGFIHNVLVEGCVINSGYDEDASEKMGFHDGAMGFNIAAACPDSSTDEDVVGAVIDGLIIQNCRVLGARRYGINMLVGISIPQPGTDFMNMKAKIVDCVIRNMKVLNSEFDYCREMAITLSGGCMNNYGSLLENLEIGGCRVVYGICGMGFSGAGPIIPTSVSRNMGMRHGTIHDNTLIMMDLPVNEPSAAINLTTARSEGFAGVEVYDCFVEDVDIYRNTVIGADQAIQVVCANSMGDTAVALSNNRISDVRIYENHIKDSRTAFVFMAAYAEGRRFDWNWGWRKQDYTFAELSKTHEPTICFYDNVIRNVDCHDNDINGCANEIVCVAGLGRGHARFKNNKITENFRYYDNHFERSEGHVNIAGTYYSDWVRDEGGNEVHIISERGNHE